MNPARKAASNETYAAALRALLGALPTLKPRSEVSSRTYATAVAYALVHIAARLAFLANTSEEKLADYLKETVSGLHAALDEQRRTSANARTILVAKAHVCHDEEGHAVVDAALDAMDGLALELARIRDGWRLAPAPVTLPFGRVLPKER